MDGEQSGFVLAYTSRVVVNILFTGDHLLSPVVAQAQPEWCICEAAAPGTGDDPVE